MAFALNHFGDSQVGFGIRPLIEDSDRVFASVISLWEIAIKLSINKLTLKFEFQDLPNFLDELEINVLSRKAQLNIKPA
jgi:PIN domain nuclease of toxin-antitoxin system